MERKIKLKSLNNYITCKICLGYFIDATTVTECLHTCACCVMCAVLGVVLCLVCCVLLSVRSCAVANNSRCSFRPALIIVCKSCLVKHLEENSTCPTCESVIHQSHPLQYISFDRTMQDIVYKLVPNLQESEYSQRNSIRDSYVRLLRKVPSEPHRQSSQIWWA